MQTFFDDLFDRFHELHNDLLKAIEDLPDEALDWVPGPDTSSINILVIHLTGAERYWIGAVALKEPTDRVRAKEFQVRGLSAGDLKKRLVDEDDFCKKAIKQFSLEDLQEIRTSPRDNKTFLVGWCLAHALEHTALHLGQLQLTRQLWEQQKKSN
jgi:uncharacterized damage-inducible protein DinB